MSTVEYFASSGTWVCPTGVSSIIVECWGSGGYTQGGISVPSGGAGGGAYAKKTVIVTPGVGYPYYVGSDGEDTYWVNASTVMAKGGMGCDNSITGSPGGLASESVGDVKYSGGYGGDATQTGEFDIDTPGGGGGGAGSGGNGNNATDNIGGSGSSEYGGNGGSAVRMANGQPGQNAGGGGAGCFDTYVSGGIGFIRITYDVVPIADLSFQKVCRGIFGGAFRSMR